MKVTKSIIRVKKMDCPSEETMIRGQLAELPSIHLLEFNIPGRIFTVYHTTEDALIVDSINALSLDAQLLSSESTEMVAQTTGVEQVQRSTLIILLAVNAGMFVIELTAGMLSDSMGLVGDGLDMLADASVYSLALYAVGRSPVVKKRVTLFSGLAQLSLALVLSAEVVRKFVTVSEPLSLAMIVVSCIALLANVYCLYLITPLRRGETHMTASWIFSANDVLVNCGVILAGVLVYVMKSPIPDLLIGSIITLIVISGAVRIMRLARVS